MRGRVWLVAALAVGATLAIPAASGAQAPAQDSVSGSGVAGFFGGFEIDVRSGPTGENPTGQASFQSAVGLLSGPASCLAVRDNVATFNIQTTSAFGQVTFEVTDNAGLGLPDVISGIPTTRSAGDCSPLSGAVSGTVSSGDVVVVDAPPLPTSKDQCKKGGWRDFGVFKNQGDCVSFVATGGKNPPGGP
jgi:hypothetical protein